MFPFSSTPLFAYGDDGVLAGIVFGALVALGIYIAIDYLIAKTFYDIACQKGHDERKYFHFCFWLGAVGYIMVAALPDRGMQNVSVSEKHPKHAHTTFDSKGSKPSDELPPL